MRPEVMNASYLGLRLTHLRHGNQEEGFSAVDETSMCLTHQDAVSTNSHFFPFGLNPAVFTCLVDTQHL